MIHLHIAKLLFDERNSSDVLSPADTFVLTEVGVTHLKKALETLKPEDINNAEAKIQQWLPFCSEIFQRGWTNNANTCVSDVIKAAKTCVSDGIKDYVVTNFKPTKWSEIVGLDKTKESIRLVTTIPIKYPEQNLEGKVNGVLLYG
jgi:hypothetical protein